MGRYHMGPHQRMVQTIMPRCNCALHQQHRHMKRQTPLLCRLFGHKCGPYLTNNFWVAVEHRCKRCGWLPNNE